MNKLKSLLHFSLLVFFAFMAPTWAMDNDHWVSQRYHKMMHAFFLTSLSQDTDLMRNIKQRIYQRFKTHTLDCSTAEGLEILKTPFLMFYCRTLRLTNVLGSAQCFNALQEAQRYFGELELRVELSSDFDRGSTWGSKILKAIQKLTKRGIQVHIGTL